MLVQYRNVVCQLKHHVRGLDAFQRSVFGSAGGGRHVDRRLSGHCTFETRRMGRNMGIGSKGATSAQHPGR